MIDRIINNALSNLEIKEAVDRVESGLNQKTIEVVAEVSISDDESDILNRLEAGMANRPTIEELRNSLKYDPN